MSQADCKAEFRVEKQDLALLAKALGIPATFIPAKNRVWWNERIMYTVKKLSAPLSLQRHDPSFWKAGYA